MGRCTQTQPGTRTRGHLSPVEVVLDRLRPALREAPRVPSHSRPAGGGTRQCPCLAGGEGPESCCQQAGSLDSAVHLLCAHTPAGLHTRHKHELIRLHHTWPRVRPLCRVFGLRGVRPPVKVADAGLNPGPCHFETPQGGLSHSGAPEYRLSIIPSWPGPSAPSQQDRPQGGGPSSTGVICHGGRPSAVSYTHLRAHETS